MMFGLGKGINGSDGLSGSTSDGISSSSILWSMFWDRQPWCILSVAQIRARRPLAIKIVDIMVVLEKNK